MDPLFIVAAGSVGAAFAWLPVRDAICVRRGHKMGAERLLHALEDGSYETEMVCLCRSRSVVTRRCPSTGRKEHPWAVPASGTTPATSP